MDYNEIVRQTRCTSFEGVLTVLSGLRITPAYTDEDVAYNNALGDVYDYILESYSDSLYGHTVRCGKWQRD